MNKPYPFQDLKNLLEPAQSITIFLPEKSQFDHVAAALALKLALEKKGKSTSVLSPTPMIVEFNRLVGVDTIGKRSEQGGNLVISLNYPLDQIEKVSYNEEGGRLNLVIQPKAGAPRAEKEQAQFSYQGGGKDLQITVGVENLSRLGQNFNQIDAQNLINIDSSPSNGQFGKLNIVDPGASSCSEMMVALLYGLGLMVDEDIANNLYLGIENTTRNFSSEKVNADTFEAVAACLRWGAKRMPPSPKPFFGGVQTQPLVKSTPQTKPLNQPQKPPVGSSSAPSPDWLEPKIFKSSNIS